MLGGNTEATARQMAPIPHIAYDRLLMFEFDGKGLHILPEIEVETKEGKHLTVKSNLQRIITRVPMKTDVWYHLAG